MKFFASARSKKSLLLSVFLLSSFPLSATLIKTDSIRKANDLYMARGTSRDGLENVREAIKIYDSEIKNFDDPYKKAILYLKSVKASFFLGEQTSNTKMKRKIFKEGHEKAQKGYLLLQEGDHLGISRNDDERTKDLLGRLYYWYGASLGRWGEARGIVSSLSKWNDLRKHMDAVIKLGQERVVSYGVYRLLGRAYHRMPAPFGNKKKSQSFLIKAFYGSYSRTLKTSHFPFNSYVLAESYISNKKETNAKAILEPTMAVLEDSEKIRDLNQDYIDRERSYNPDLGTSVHYRLIETKEELELGKKVFQKLSQ